MLGTEATVPWKLKVVHPHPKREQSSSGSYEYDAFIMKSKLIF